MNTLLRPTGPPLVSSLGVRRPPHPLKLAPRDVPHAVIEPLYSCNLRCRACYNREREHVKSEGEVIEEIELALRKRRLDTISLLGGEPTLHPQLESIVRAIKERGLNCQILTNGVPLLERPGLLERLVAAGVDRVIVHADVGQGHTDLEGFVTRVFDRLERAGVSFSRAVTVYPETQGTVPELLLRHAHHRRFDGVLATIARRAPVRDEVIPWEGSSLLEEHQALQARLALEPSTYVPSSADDLRASWLVYFMLLNAKTSRAFPISPRVDRLLRDGFRWFSGRHGFGAALDPRWTPLVSVALVLLEVLLDPRRLVEALRALRRSSTLRALRLLYVVVQSGPERDAHGRLHLCHGCPDATVRNGKMVPVCLADHIEPLPTSLQSVVDGELRCAVLEHLGERP